MAALALVVSGAFGGLEAIAEPMPPEVAADEEVRTGPLDVSFLRARAIDDLKPYAAPSEGNRFLVLVFKVRNVSDRPVSSRSVLSKDLDVVPDGSGLVDGAVRRVMSMADLSDIGEFQPDLTYEAAVVVETKGQDITSRVEVGVPGYTWRGGIGAVLQYDWRGMEIVARGDFAVKDVPDVPEDTQ